MARRSLGTLTIDVIAEIGGFAAGLDRSERQTEKWRKKVESEAKLAGVALGAAIAGGIALIARNTIAAEREVAQLDAIIRSTGGAAGYTRKQLLDMADTLSAKSTFSGGEIVEAQTRLLSYSGILGQNIPRAMQAIIDQSARLGISVSQSAESIGRALESPSKAAAALAQQGFGAAFTEEVRGTIDELVKAGKEGEAQIMILEILEESYGGAAQAARDTFGGALQALGNTINDLTTAGDGSLNGATAAVNTLIETLNDPAVKEGFGNLISGAVTAIGYLAELAAKAGSVTKFLAEEVAARAVGAAAGDTVRIQQQIDRQRRQLAEFDMSLDNRGRPMAGYDPLTGEGARRFNPSLGAQREELRRSMELLKLSDELAQAAEKSKKAAEATTPTGVTGDEAARAAAAAAAAAAEGAKKQAEAQRQLQRAYEGSSLQLQRQIELFDTSADKSGRATELQKLNFELATGSLRGLSEAQKESLRLQAMELDRLGAIKDANEEAAKATEAFAKLKQELNKEDSLGLDLARERLKVIQAAAAVGSANDDEYFDAARKAIQQVGGKGSEGFDGPDAMYGGARGEFEKINKAEEEQLKKYAAQLEALEGYRQSRADLESKWNEEEERIKAEHEDRLAGLERSRRDVALAAAETGFGAVADIMRESFGEQSGLYKAAFIAQKAAAIAQATLAINAGIAEAAKNPWPTNLIAMASVAAATAGLISNITAVGMAHDGIDSVPQDGTWLLQKGERVMTSQTSAKLDATLDRVNSSSSGDAANGDTFNFNVNGSIGERERMMMAETVRQAVAESKKQTNMDMARGTGISRTMRATHNVGRRVG